jgi:hypothetical protein
MNNTDTPISTGTSPNLVVTQNGQYFVYLESADNCWVYDTPPITVAFTPVPETPLISGSQSSCPGNAIILNVPENPSLIYTWTLGTTTWTGSQLNDVQTNPGPYTYTVIAQVALPGGGFCSSPAASFTVTVSDPLVTPELLIANVTCDPYYAEVYVTNPQAGVEYFWSNGTTGISTSATHDGPIEVRAQSGDCSVTAQIDLPIDILSMAWVFPQGCYENCVLKAAGYIIGPFGDYAYWEWQQDHTMAAAGTNEIQDFHGITPSHDYQLLIDNGYCHPVIENMSMQQIPCSGCDLDIKIVSVHAIVDPFTGLCVYEVIFTTNNIMGTPVWVTFTAPNGEGYFINSTLSVTTGPATHTVLFYPVNGFAGGPVEIWANGQWEEEDCTTKFLIVFPELCEGGRIVAEDQVVNSLDGIFLLPAPNPATGSTSIFYKYGSGKESMTIEVIDLLGRTLETLYPTNNSGNLPLDCSNYAAGQYILVLKEVGNIIKSSKLIIR